MSVISVHLPSESYDIAIAPGNLDLLGEKMVALNLGKKVLLVSNSAVFGHYGEKATLALKNAGILIFRQ